MRAEILSVIIQPTGTLLSPTGPARSAAPAEPELARLPSDQAVLSAAPAPAASPTAPTVPATEQAPSTPVAPSPIRESPPTVLTQTAEEPGWRGELLDLKGRMDYLYGLQTAQCGDWWHGTVQQLPGPARGLSQELANQTLTEARMQDPTAQIAQVAHPVGVGVNGLLLAAIQTDNDVRLDPSANPTEQLKHNLFVTTITGEMIGRLSPDQVQEAMGEAGIGAGQSTRFAEALATRLSPEDIQACQQGAAESPLFRLTLHPELPAMAASLSEHVGEYQGAVLSTRSYLEGLSQVQIQQTAVASEVGAFFERHPEALLPG